jgi:hypothetical protein
VQDALTTSLLPDRAGRTGMAYSLFTREELPFVLDLHLFLGRRLAPAPRRSVGDAAAAPMEAGGEGGKQATSLFGSFPLVRVAGFAQRCSTVLHLHASCTTYHLVLASCQYMYRHLRCCHAGVFGDGHGACQRSHRCLRGAAVRGKLSNKGVYAVTTAVVTCQACNAAL